MDGSDAKLKDFWCSFVQRGGVPVVIRNQDKFAVAPAEGDFGRRPVFVTAVLEHRVGYHRVQAEDGDGAIAAFLSKFGMVAEVSKRWLQVSSQAPNFMPYRLAVVRGDLPNVEGLVIVNALDMCGYHDGMLAVEVLKAFGEGL